MLHSLSIQSVQQSMASSISRTCTAVCLTPYNKMVSNQRIPESCGLRKLVAKSMINHPQTFSKIQALATKCTLIDFPIVCSGKWQPIVLKLNHRFWCLSAHILNCILVTCKEKLFPCVIEQPAQLISWQ